MIETRPEHTITNYKCIKRCVWNSSALGGFGQDITVSGKHAQSATYEASRRYWERHSSYRKWVFDALTSGAGWAQGWVDLCFK